jgi:aspartyl-tRNA(Asn)/glutamyl-tRNA(Gln) amidotransferase subunit C
LRKSSAAQGKNVIFHAAPSKKFIARWRLPLPDSMAFQPDDIRRLARLSRIAVDEPDATHFAQELSGIFGLIDQLQAVETQGVEPLAHPLDAVLHSAQRLREDRATETSAREANMANAPEVEGGLFLVPKVIE